ncbi:LOW QUALITY PROTEIN: uncharacterized protein LOC6549832 [Drosophila erecta]
MAKLKALNLKKEFFNSAKPSEQHKVREGLANNKGLSPGAVGVAPPQPPPPPPFCADTRPIAAFNGIENGRTEDPMMTKCVPPFVRECVHATYVPRTATTAAPAPVTRNQDPGSCAQDPESGIRTTASTVGPCVRIYIYSMYIFLLGAKEQRSGEKDTGRRSEDSGQRVTAAVYCPAPAPAPVDGGWRSTGAPKLRRNVAGQVTQKLPVTSYKWPHLIDYLCVIPTCQRKQD